MSAAILSDAEAKEAEASRLYASLYEAPPVGTDPHRWRNDTLDRIEELREEAASIRTRIESSREHIRRYYGLELNVGLEVTHAGLPGRIVGFSGQHVEVQHDGEDHSSTCHAMSEMEYPQGTRIGPDPDERFAHLVEVRTA